MSITQHYRATIQKLKKRIHALEKQQQHGRKKLQRAMTEARKLAKSYKSKFTSKTLKSAKKNGKSVFDKASEYAQTVLDMERKMMRAAEKNSKALAQAFMKMDKEAISRFVRKITGSVGKSHTSAKSQGTAKPKRKAKRKSS
jgi:hypothetical protein